MHPQPQSAKSSAAPPFAPEEFRARRLAAAARMREAGLDGLLVADPANLYYLTGYNAWSFYMPQLLHLDADGEALLLMREMDANGAHRTAVGIEPASVLGYPETLVHRPDAHPGEWMADRLREFVGAGARRLGIESDSAFYTVRTHRALEQRLPGWRLEDSGELVNRVRLVKSAAEVEVLRAAGRVAGAAMRAGIAALAPGRPMHEVAAEISAAQVRGVPGADGDYPAIVPMLPTGAGADTPHLTWTGEPLPSDEPISFELAGVHRRYHCPLARTAVIGRAGAELERLAAVTVEGLEAAIAAVRPGASAHDVAAAFHRVIEAAGYEKSSRLGYSIGIGYPPDWGERTVSIRLGERTELVEDMTFHLIAGMWQHGFGFENSESIRVGADGAELLSDVPRGLVVVDGGGA